MADSELITGLPQICRTFPRLPDPDIGRQHLLTTLDTIFQSDTQAIFVEGAEGMGKTVLLAQYALLHSDTAFSLFIRPASRIAYAPEYLRMVLSEQIYWLLNQSPLRANVVDDSLLRTQLALLQRRTTRKQRFLFVIDGLEDIPHDDTRTADVILRDILPLGLPNFLFLFSGNLTHFKNLLHRSVRATPFHLPIFSVDETARYLTDCQLSSDHLTEVHRMCKGIPGRLATIRRALLSGLSLDSLLLADTLTNLPDFLALDWRAVDTAADRDKRLLAAIAFGRKGYTVNDLAGIFAIDPHTLSNSLLRTGVIDIDPKTQEATFLSETHRRHATQVLSTLKADVVDLLIAHLEANRDTDAALVDLPTYYHQAGRLRELLDHLTPDYFIKLAQRTESFTPLHRLADLAVATADRLAHTESLIRFSLGTSVLNQLDGAQVWRSEVEARLALSDHDGALALAQTAVAKEDRLHLLAVVAKSQSETTGNADAHVLLQIRALCDQLDATTLGERAVDIATDLVTSDPDLAIHLIEAAAPPHPEANSLDWAFTALSIAALRSPLAADRSTDILEKTRRRVRDPKIERFLAEAALFTKATRPADVIASVAQLDSRNRLFVLRRWAAAHPDSPSATPIVDHALDLLVHNPSDTPTTRDLRELATPRPSITVTEEATRLVDRFDTLRTAILHLSPTQDDVRLQLLLARTERQYDAARALTRLKTLFEQVASLSLSDLRSTCLAWIISALDQIDPHGALETSDGLHSRIASELDRSLTQLLELTANQDNVTEDVIRALALSRPQKAIDLALALNTEERRDNALATFIRRALSRWPLRISLDFILTALKHITSPPDRDTAYLEALERLWDHSADPSLELTAPLLNLINTLALISSSEYRCRARCYGYALLSSRGSPPTLLTALLSDIDLDWHATEAEWHKIDLAFFIARLLAPHAPDLARRYLSDGATLRDTAPIASAACASTYIGCIRLSLRAYSGLFPRSLDTEEHLETLISLIQRITSATAATRLWSELTLRLVVADRMQSARRIVSDHLRPTIESVSSRNPAARWHTIVSGAAALFAVHRPTAYAFSDDLPDSIRDDVYVYIVDFILRQRSISDPYHYIEGDGYDLSYERALDLCELLAKATEDSFIYSTLVKLCDSLLSRRNRTRISKTQRLDLATRAEQVVIPKLPDGRNIRHNGYLLSSRATIARLRPTTLAYWQDLLAQAREIPNASDRAFVISLIVTGMATAHRVQASAVATEALALIEQLTAGHDRINRLVTLSEALIDLNTTQALQQLRHAMELSKLKTSNNALVEVQQRIIDVAHRLDPNLAASLASLIDDDPARIESRRSLKERVELLDLKKQMLEEPAGAVSADHAARDYPDAAWMNLGALNSGKLEPQHLDAVRYHLRVAARLSLDRSYPIFAWVVENAVRRLSGTDQARDALLPVFDAAVLSAELAIRLAAKTSGALRLAQEHAHTSNATGTSQLFKAGERARALEVVREWLSTNLSEELKICDAYFGVEDLEILRLVKSVKPACRVWILTSRAHLGKTPQPWEETFATHWRMRISDQDPPDTTIVVVGSEEGGQSPIHDRWWLTGGGGMSLGTSFNSLGVTGVSEIRVLSHSESDAREREINSYLLQERREFNRRRLRYTTFSL